MGQCLTSRTRENSALTKRRIETQGMPAPSARGASYTRPHSTDRFLCVATVHPPNTVFMPSTCQAPTWALVTGKWQNKVPNSHGSHILAVRGCKISVPIKNSTGDKIQTRYLHSEALQLWPF